MKCVGANNLHGMKVRMVTFHGSLVFAVAQNYPVITSPHHWRDWRPLIIALPHHWRDFRPIHRQTRPTTSWHLFLNITHAYIQQASHTNTHSTPDLHMSSHLLSTCQFVRWSDLLKFDSGLWLTPVQLMMRFYIVWGLVHKSNPNEMSSLFVQDGGPCLLVSNYQLATPQCNI